MIMLLPPPNPTLEGHKLLILSQFKPDDEYLNKLHTEFPGLKIIFHELGFPEKKPRPDFDEKEWKDVTVLLTGSALPDPEIAPKLQYVQLQSAGANHILKHPLFTDTDVAFATANGVHGPQISEWIITTFLSFQHQIPKYIDNFRQGKWLRGDDWVEDAVGRTIGILGYGSIGRQTARVATALGFKVHAYTLHPRPTPESKRDNGYTPPGLGDPEGKFPSKWFSGASKADLHAFLGSGLDLLVVATPLTDKTSHLLAAEEFEILSAKKTFVSNIARGPVVNTEDLIEALDKELIRGAALDVTDPEPLPEGHPLWKAKNLLITPHISGMSTSYAERILAILDYNLKRLSEGKRLVNVVNKREGY
ncbi:d-isomer specific 2-hydroxyacid dehydrogenase [Colletotrichum truncatum]|uniref:D-isomer specific 2-hydroxyacid dehydrogenase n=1 Tax=Colletotrichum truncatum TaxID=5467 RepID=A0ACC3ZLG7_COLTU|nr:d-isomer specific 2-hydroxyacid dehydrogenase [Colletotrichum truncatum]KAF6783906.1 d-isomer specific 2-hydroxyacid dehydrogenase [Colletotrichum truncatum]